MRLPVALKRHMDEYLLKRLHGCGFAQHKKMNDNHATLCMIQAARSVRPISGFNEIGFLFSLQPPIKLLYPIVPLNALHRSELTPCTQWQNRANVSADHVGHGGTAHTARNMHGFIRTLYRRLSLVATGVPHRRQTFPCLSGQRSRVQAEAFVQSGSLGPRDASRSRH